MRSMKYEEIIKTVNTYCKKGILRKTDTIGQQIFKAGELVNIYGLLDFKGTHYYLIGSHKDTRDFKNAANLLTVFNHNNSFDFYLPLDFKHFINSIRIDIEEQDYLIKFKWVLVKNIELIKDNKVNSRLKGILKSNDIKPARQPFKWID